MKYFKIGFSVFFILLISFFVVKSCVHPKRTITNQETASTVPFFSKLMPPQKNIVIAPRVISGDKEKNLVSSTQGPHVAIILDDWGKNYSVLKNAIEIHRPLTLAVLPNLIHSRRIAEEAHQNGLGVMLHLPMEPFNKKAPLEPRTIKTSMTDSQIKQIVDNAVAAIPHVQGVNNHMGSAVTSDARVMKLILERLKSKNLFFVDSHVVAKTQGSWAALQTGIRFAERDVFIDNENELGAIKRQLEKAKQMALASGEAIVIGHDRKLTLEAIKEMLPEFDRAGVRLVLARDVVKSS